MKGKLARVFAATKQDEALPRAEAWCAEKYVGTTVDLGEESTKPRCGSESVDDETRAGFLRRAIQFLVVRESIHEREERLAVFE